MNKKVDVVSSSRYKNVMSYSRRNLKSFAIYFWKEIIVKKHSVNSVPQTDIIECKHLISFFCTDDATECMLECVFVLL